MGSGKILYKCTDCPGEQEVDEEIHRSAWHYIDCDCGENMVPADESDLETMDIYDEHD